MATKYSQIEYAKKHTQQVYTNIGIVIRLELALDSRVCEYPKIHTQQAYLNTRMVK